MIITCLLLILSLPLDIPALAQDSEPSLQDLDKDLDRLMEDERLFDQYYKCLLDTGPCDKDTTNFKDMVLEALKRECARCSPTQRRDTVELLRMVMECRPREYAEIERHFDPTGSFRGKYQASALARGIRPGHGPCPGHGPISGHGRPMFYHSPAAHLLRDDHSNRNHEKKDVQEDEESCALESR